MAGVIGIGDQWIQHTPSCCIIGGWWDEILCYVKEERLVLGNQSAHGSLTVLLSDHEYRCSSNVVAAFFEHGKDSCEMGDVAYSFQRPFWVDGEL